MPKSTVATMKMFSSLENSRTLCQPKSVGASWHPDKGVFHFGWHILAMSQSSQSIMDHIAEMLRFISNTQSFWFTLERALTMATTSPIDSGKEKQGDRRHNDGNGRHDNSKAKTPYFSWRDTVGIVERRKSRFSPQNDWTGDCSFFPSKRLNWRL